jgi:hypothetical protein
LADIFGNDDRAALLIGELGTDEDRRNRDGALRDGDRVLAGLEHLAAARGERVLADEPLRFRWWVAADDVVIGEGQRQGRDEGWKQK